MKKALKIITIPSFIAISFILCSCESYKSKNITDYLDSTWKSNSDSILNIEVYVDSSSDITSNVTYDNETISFSNYIVSEAIYFVTLDKSKSFIISHSYVKDDSYIECRVKKEEVSKIFEIEEGVDVIYFTLTKK